MIRLLLAAMLLAGASRIEWPGVEDGSPIVLALSANGEELTLSVTNNLTPTYTTPSVATLELGEHRVGIVFDQDLGNNPDLVTIAPPPGFIAYPNDFHIEEGETVLVRIFRANLS